MGRMLLTSAYVTYPVTFEDGLIVTAKSHLHGTVNGVNLVNLSETIIYGNKKFDQITASK